MRDKLFGILRNIPNVDFEYIQSTVSKIITFSLKSNKAIASRFLLYHRISKESEEQLV